MPLERACISFPTWYTCLFNLLCTHVSDCRRCIEKKIMVAWVLFFLLQLVDSRAVWNSHRNNKSQIFKRLCKIPWMQEDLQWKHYYHHISVRLNYLMYFEDIKCSIDICDPRQLQRLLTSLIHTLKLCLGLWLGWFVCFHH